MFLTAIASVGVALLLLVAVCAARRRARLPLPPGPRSGSFFAGAAPLLPATEPWKQYATWCKQYGDTISFRVYNRRFIVLHTRAAAHALLSTRAATYSNRPPSTMLMAPQLCDRSKTAFNIPATDARHRQYRRALHTGLAARSARALVERETGVLVRRLGDAARGRAAEAHVRRHAGTVIMMLAFGYTPKETGDFFIGSAEEASKVTGRASAPGRWLVEYYPILRFVPSWFPGAGFKRQANEWRERMSALTNMPHEWVKTQMASGKYVECFTSRHLAALGPSGLGGEQEDIIKWAAAGLYVGAADTTVSALLSFLMLMAIHPDIQHRAQEELDRVVEPDSERPCAVGADDVEHLPYLTCIMKEVLRFAPVGPMAIPHSALVEDEYNGFRIPKDATIIANVWAMMHDPTTYPSPSTFDPSRFLQSDEKPAQLDPRGIAFGFGRRVCPGSAFAEMSMSVTMGSILAAFDIVPAKGTTPPKPEELEYTTGLTSHIKLFDIDFIPRQRT
ncbi:cytochrome P450 [Dentipellis sp. KUC8613]|nr:cytochrome P450 [Dentipellis sp. KUC8613]